MHHKIASFILITFLSTFALPAYAFVKIQVPRCIDVKTGNWTPCPIVYTCSGEGPQCAPPPPPACSGCGPSIGDVDLMIAAGCEPLSEVDGFLDLDCEDAGVEWSCSEDSTAIPCPSIPEGEFLCATSEDLCYFKQK